MKVVTATIALDRESLEKWSMTINITLLGLLVRRREVAGKRQGKGRRRGGSESGERRINRPWHSSCIVASLKNDGRRVIERWSGYETYKHFNYYTMKSLSPAIAFYQPLKESI